MIESIRNALISQMRTLYHQISAGLGIDDEENIEATFQQVYFDVRAFKTSLISLLPILILFVSMMMSVFWYTSKNKMPYFGAPPEKFSRQDEVQRIHQDLENLLKETSEMVNKFKMNAINFIDRSSITEDQKK